MDYTVNTFEETAESKANLWLNEIYSTINELYYSGETTYPCEIYRLRGIVEAASNLGQLDLYEEEMLLFQLEKIENRFEEG